MAKSDVDSKVQKILKEAEERIRAQHERQIARELQTVERKARKYFEQQEEPDVSLFLADGGKTSNAKTRKCGVCKLPGARNTFTGAKKEKHSREEHEALQASKRS